MPAVANTQSMWIIPRMESVGNCASLERTGRSSRRFDASYQVSGVAQRNRTGTGLTCFYACHDLMLEAQEGTIATFYDAGRASRTGSIPWRGRLCGPPLFAGLGEEAAPGSRRDHPGAAGPAYCRHPQAIGVREVWRTRVRACSGRLARWAG